MGVYLSEMVLLLTDFYVFSCLLCLCIDSTLTEELTLVHRVLGFSFHLSKTSITVVLSSEQRSGGTTHQAYKFFFPSPAWAVSYGLPACMAAGLNSTAILCSCFLGFVCHEHLLLFLQCFLCFSSSWHVISSGLFSVLLGSAFQSFCCWLERVWYLLGCVFCWFRERLGICTMRPFFCSPLFPALVWVLVILDGWMFCVTPQGFSVVLFCYFILWVCWRACQGHPLLRFLCLFTVFNISSWFLLSHHLPWNSRQVPACCWCLILCP